MWYPATVTAPPDTKPVSVEEAKRQVYVTHDDDNDLFDRLIAAALDHVERYCGVRFAAQTLTLTCDSFCDFARLPEAPIASVEITYVDPGGAEQTLPEAVYQLRPDGLEPRVELKPGERWPAIEPGSRITVVAEAGYVVAPDAVKHAMLVFIAQAYDDRAVDSAGDWTIFDSLLTNYRRNA